MSSTLPVPGSSFRIAGFAGTHAPETCLNRPYTDESVSCQYVPPAIIPAGLFDVASNCDRSISARIT